MINLEKFLATKPKYIIGLLQAGGVATYVLLLVTLITNLDKNFEHDTPFLAPIIFLMTFIISALICSSLMLAYPVWLTAQGKIKDAAAIVSWSIAWLLSILLIVVLIAFSLR